MARQLGPSPYCGSYNLFQSPRGLRRTLLRGAAPQLRRHTTNGVALQSTSLAVPLVLGLSPNVSAGAYHGASLWFTTLCALSVALGALSYNLMAVLAEFFSYERRGQEAPRARTYLHGVDVTHSRFLQLPAVLAAVEFAAEAHRNQRRKTGEPYVTHCIETALIVEACLPQSHSATEQERHVACIMAAVLHDVIDDTPIDLGAMTAAFGPRVAGLVIQVSKLSQMNQLLRRGKRQGWAQYSPDHFKQLRKLIVDLAFEEPLVILVKLADRLHNMRTVYVLAPEKQRSVAEETLEVWCSMAESLGWDGLKSEMEDLCFGVLQPSTYCTLRAELDRLWSLPTLTVVEEQLAEQWGGGGGSGSSSSSDSGGDGLGLKIVQTPQGPEAPVRHYARAAGVRAAAAAAAAVAAGEQAAVDEAHVRAVQAAVAATAVPLPRAATVVAAQEDVALPVAVAVNAAAAAAPPPTSSLEAMVGSSAAAAVLQATERGPVRVTAATTTAVAVIEAPPAPAPSASPASPTGSDGAAAAAAAATAAAAAAELAFVGARTVAAASAPSSSREGAGWGAGTGGGLGEPVPTPPKLGQRVYPAGGNSSSSSSSYDSLDSRRSGSGDGSSSSSDGLSRVTYDSTAGGRSSSPYPLASLGTMESVDGPLLLDEIVLPYGLTVAGAPSSSDGSGGGSTATTTGASPAAAAAYRPSAPGGPLASAEASSTAATSSGPGSSAGVSPSDQQSAGQLRRQAPAPPTASMSPHQQPRQQHPPYDSYASASRLDPPHTPPLPQRVQRPGPGGGLSLQLPGPLRPLVQSLVGPALAPGQRTAAGAGPLPGPPGGLADPSSPSPSSSGAAAGAGLPAAFMVTGIVPPSTATPAPLSPLTPQQQRLKLILSTVVPFEAVGFKSLRGLASSARRGLEVLDECAALLYNEIQIRSQAGGLAINIQGRLKSLHSVYRKMVRKQVAVAQVYDSRALRVIVDDGEGSSMQEAVEACYRLVSAVHSIWKPIKREFDDYIANPKPSGYQALHTAVRGPGGIPMEVQIKTSSMHDLAEFGAAAHWVYKEYTPLLQSPGRRGRGGGAAGERLPEGYVGQPLLRVAKDKLRYGVVVSREADGQRLVVAVKLGSTFPPHPTRVPDFAFYTGLRDYTQGKGWQVPGHGDIVLRLEEFVKCNDGRYHRRDHMGYLIPAETITLLEGFEEDAAAAAREQQRRQQQQQRGEWATTAASAGAAAAGGGEGPHGGVGPARSSVDEEVLGLDGEGAEQLRLREQMRVAFAKTQQLRSMIEWGRDAIGKYAPSPDALLSDEVSVLIWPGGRIEHWARGTTAGDIVACKGIITTGEGYDGYRVNLLINVNNRLVPEDTVLNDGDLVILAREKVRI